MPFSAVPGALRSLASIGHIVEAAPERSLTVSSGRPAPVPDARGSHWLSCCEARRGARSPGTVRAGHPSRLQMFFSTIFPLNFLERCFLGDLYLSFCLSRSMRLAQGPGAGRPRSPRLFVPFVLTHLPPPSPATQSDPRRGVAATYLGTPIIQSPLLHQG